MRSTFKIIGIGASVLTAAVSFSLRKPENVAGAVQQQLVRQADSLINAVQYLQRTTADPGHDTILQQRFRRLRLAYKRLEWAVEYFDPLTARQVNGPPVPEAELNGQVIQPDGLQPIEQLLFPHFISSKKRTLAGL